MKIINKDITTVDGNCIIAHGVNCSGVMEKGVAKSIYTKWPIVKEEFLKLSTKLANVGFTQYVYVDREKDITVYNCYTQLLYGNEKGTFYASVNSIFKCLFTIGWSHKNSFKPIYIPKIGCGLGGLDWKDVSLAILDVEKYSGAEFTVCEFNELDK